MKSKLLYLVVLGGMLFTSCSKDLEPPKRDVVVSLAGSVTFDGYCIEAEGSYDGVPLTDFEDYQSALSIVPASNTQVSLRCSTTWGETSFHIFGSHIPLSGEPDNVSFDYISPDAGATTISDDIEYTGLTSIKGWIRKIDFTRTSPRVYAYDCDINIECTIDGKQLTLKITSAYPFGYVFPPI